MNISKYKVSPTENAVRIQLAGQFTFHSRKAFNEAGLSALAHVGSRQIALDMADVDYLDSAALGMLLLLREKAALTGQQIVLLRPRGRVLQILQVANFERYFSFEQA